MIRAIDSSQPFIDIQTLDALMIDSVGMQRFYLVVLSAFAVFAIGLAAVGIYAAYSFAIASRTAEIGVRLALGAAPRKILWDIVGRALLLGGLATALGLAGAAGAARILNSLLFNVTTTDPLTYASVGAVMLATVAIATLLPASRAARINPLVALRK